MAARGERGTVRTVTLDRIQGLAHAVLHDAKHIDADSEAGASAARAQTVARPELARWRCVADQLESVAKPSIDNA